MPTAQPRPPAAPRTDHRTDHQAVRPGLRPAVRPGIAPPAGGRNDACPGALRLHSADDGALARVRMPGGVLTVAQAEGLGAAAERWGDGELHLTSRGNVQLRGLDEGCGAGLAAALDAAGLLPSAAHERVRNVVASPLSGLDGLGHRAVGAWLRELDDLVCASGRTPALSGRFLFAVDDGRGDTDALEPDIALVAGAEGTATVRIGAGPDRTVLAVPAEAAPRVAVHAAEAFLAAAEAARAGGAERVWRVGELPGGAGAVRALALDAVRRAGVGDLLDVTELTDLSASAGASASASGGGAARGRVPVAGVLPGGLSVLVPLGRLAPHQWSALLEAAAGSGGELRLTPWRGVVVPGAGAVESAALAATGLVTAPDGPWEGVTACVGRPGCAKALADVRADAAATVRTVPDAALPVHLPGGLPVHGSNALPVHWSGCDRRCGRPRGDRVDVVATGTGYQVSAVRGGTVRGTSVTEAAALATTVAAARAGR
ncbi:cobalamin biosynthesis protein CobG [Streptomyces sp. LE64]|uniref:cobalamin biosynthesis protein CobG n=1 Tax=Streptomyces sp. LE64 TaxID=3448653 RepID=UPI0040427FEB